LVGLAFRLLGLEPAALWGFVTACVAVIPILGSALVWAPAAVLLYFNHRPLAATLLAVFGVVVVSNLDNLVRLIVYRRVSNIHPMVTLVGAFAGVRLFGIIGAFIGPLVLSYVFELIGVYEDTTRIVGVVTPAPGVWRGQ
jgi:predicted PurR-regulated permease PerM